MPAFPELGRIGAEVRGVKVQVELNAEEIGDTHRHFAISGKIKIELEGIKIGRDPGLNCAQRITDGKKIIGIDSYVISNQNLFK